VKEGTGVESDAAITQRPSHACSHRAEEAKPANTDVSPAL